MEGDNQSAQPAFHAGAVPQAPAIQVGNSHPQNDAMDTVPGIPVQTGAPAQPQPAPSFNNAMPPTAAAAESPAPSSNVGTPPTTTHITTTPTNHNATFPNTNTPAVSAVPKDGKAAAQSDFPIPLPSQAQANGAPVRQYLNENLSPFLVEVTKHVAAHRPQKPLEFVAEYFMEKSRQIEGNK